MEQLLLVDKGYTGILKYHSNSLLPKKETKNYHLTKEEKEIRDYISINRILVENVIGKLKIFGILKNKYRNKRKRLGLRFNLIAGIYNYSLNA